LVGVVPARCRPQEPTAPPHSPPPKYYSDLSKIDKIELAQVLIHLEELVFMADEIAGNSPNPATLGSVLMASPDIQPQLSS
jgi:hypothetical protein